MQKFQSTEVQNFEFSDLQVGKETGTSTFKPFNFNELNGQPSKRNNISEETLRSERTYEKKNNFKIDGVVRESRGLSRQEQNDLESQIQAEVNRRLETAYHDAYQEGIEKGKDEGRAEATAHYQEELAAKVNEFSQIIDEMTKQSDKIVEKNRHDIYEFIKRFTKWIVLKEIDEKLYLENLLEKLLLELNVRKNLIVKVGRANFSKMPEVIQTVETRRGQLTNVRVEIVPEINHPGIILESENGLIDGSLEGVFQNIDKIFEQVVKHE